MKISFFFLGLIMIISSCSTTKEGCYTGNVLDQDKAKLEVASSMPQVGLNGATSTLNELPVYNTKPIDTPVLLIGEIKQSESFDPDEQPLIAMAPVQNEENVLTAEQLKARMAEELRMVASSTESRFAGWILNRTAKKIESKDFHANEKLTFFDKVKTKIFGKLQAKYGRSGGMSTADILAIVSLSTGVVSFAAFYASYLFGIAAIVTGAIALKKGTSRRGMAIAGIVLGAVAIFFWSGWFIFY